MKRRIAIVFALCAFALTIGGAQSALAAPAGAQLGQPQAEIFATNNTAIITSPSDPA